MLDRLVLARLPWGKGTPTLERLWCPRRTGTRPRVRGRQEGDLWAPIAGLEAANAALFLDGLPNAGSRRCNWLGRWPFSSLRLAPSFCELAYQVALEGGGKEGLDLLGGQRRQGFDAHDVARHQEPEYLRGHKCDP